MPEAYSRESQMRIDLGGEQVELVRIRAVEELGEPFRISVRIVATLGEVDLLPHLGKPVRLTCLEDGELQRYFHGILVEGQFVEENSTGHNYELTILPWTELIDENIDYAIHQDLSVIDIISKTLDDAGITDYDLGGITKSYDKRTYCVQYRESDFTFISRLMQEEGIYYYFEHQEDKHVMKLCDAQSVHPASFPPRLEFSSSSVSVFLTSSDPRQGDDTGRKYIHNFHDRVSSNLRGKLTVRDYDFEKADKPVEASSVGDNEHPHDDKEVYIFPGNLVEESRAKHLGDVALEAQRATRQIFVGETQSSGLAVGTHLGIFNHPHERKNADYLITKTYHSIVAETYRSGENMKEESFNVRLEAIPVSRPFRPKRTVPRPVTHGLESAIVTGPEGEEIYTDEWGRVKVRFHWDRSGSPGDKSTCWIRVSQTGGLGNLILPRVTHEVLIDFLNGDPDRPIVVGRVFNSHHKPIYKLPEHKTRALWRTKRYGKTGQYPETKDLDTGKPGVNELRFEDKGGSEEVFMHAERDMNTRIRHEETHHVGRNQQVMVGNDRELIVGNNETIEIGNDQSRQITNNQTLDVGEQQEETIGTHRKVSIGQTDQLEAGQTIEIKAGTSIRLEAGTSIEFKVGSTTISMDNMGINFKGPMLSLKADATVTVQSLKTDITGSAMLTETGGIVMIN